MKVPNVDIASHRQLGLYLRGAHGELSATNMTRPKLSPSIRIRKALVDAVVGGIGMDALKRTAFQACDFFVDPFPPMSICVSVSLSHARTALLPQCRVGVAFGGAPDRASRGFVGRSVLLLARETVVESRRLVHARKRGFHDSDSDRLNSARDMLAAHRRLPIV